MKVILTKAGAVVTLEPGDSLGEPHIVWGGPRTTFPPVPVTGSEEAIANLAKGYLTRSLSLYTSPLPDAVAEGGCALCKAVEKQPVPLPSDVACEVCGKPSCGVCASPLAPISHAICSECVQTHRIPWGELVAGLYGVPRDAVADWVRPYLEATCLFFDKTEDELWEAIEKFSKEYETECRRSSDER